MNPGAEIVGHPLPPFRTEAFILRPLEVLLADSPQLERVALPQSRPVPGTAHIQWLVDIGAKTWPFRLTLGQLWIWSSSRGQLMPLLRLHSSPLLSLPGPASSSWDPKSLGANVHSDAASWGTQPGIVSLLPLVFQTSRLCLWNRAAKTASNSSLL